jgi:hypothetical protein
MHKLERYEKIFKVNPDERVPNPVVDMTLQDEEIIMNDLDNALPENDTQLHKMLVLEKGYEAISEMVLDIY